MRFIDLCSGIGGFRLALETLGHSCVAFSEIDSHAIKVYKANFDISNELEIGDLTNFTGTLPQHDLMTAGFPCQPFSLAGKRAGFSDPRGSIFDHILRLANAHSTKILLLENVPNLLTHNKGASFSHIISSLTASCYHVSYAILCSSLVSLQKRKRLYIIAHKEKEYDFSFIKPDIKKPTTFQDIISLEDVEKYRISPKLFAFLQAHKAKHNKNGSGFGYTIVYPHSTSTRTITHRYYKDGSECLVADREGAMPRKLTISEIKSLFNFPQTFQTPISLTRIYMSFGNSVVVNLIKQICMFL